MRIEHIGDATLYLGDCLEILPTLGKVDAVVTDPPYLVTPTSITHYKPGRGPMMKGWMAESYPVGNGNMFDVPEFAAWAGPVFSACKADADAYFMTNDRNLSPMLSAMGDAGWKHHNILVWQKPNGIPNRWYFKDCEFTLYLFRGKARKINKPSSTVHFFCGHVRGREHNSQKPVELMELYIGNSTTQSCNVLDPFMGSGTTGVACAKLGRKFIGIEIEERYFDIACKRVQKAYDQPDLFVEPPAKAKQEAFDV